MLIRTLAAVAAVAVLSAVTPAFARSSMSSMTMSMPKCAAGDAVVWVNTRSKVYYLPGASYYGKTKHGKYVCESQAGTMGMHAAKGQMMSGSNGSMMSGHHKMHHGKGMMGSGSMGSGSMGSGSMGSGSPKAPASPGTIQVTPNPNPTSSPSN